MNFLTKILGIFCLIAICRGPLLAQSDSLREVSGTLKDVTTGEPLIGANVMYMPGKVVQTDVDGNYSLKLPDGAYTFTVSYPGYAQFTQPVTVAGQKVNVESTAKSQTDLDEVEVVADVARTRETPVAISNISEKQIKEELGARDLPMMLNSTPGVYATQQGGGAGDSRINIRGFDQRYVAVMVDGVPVNDMENGQVYWSNWSGLSEITRSMQVQRGLGASRLAVPSVGGTMNILTQSIDTKRSLIVKEDRGSNNYNRIALGFNSGLIKNKFGLTLAGSYTSGDGWVDQTYQKTWSYFAKFQYRINSRHMITLSGNGAPQVHGQRSTGMSSAIYDRDYAIKHGVNADSIYKSPTNGFTVPGIGARGLAYNPDWGYVNGKAVNTKVNFFHKPLINLSHYFTINEKMSLSTVVYASFGKGGGTSYIGTVTRDVAGDGQIKLQDAYNANIAKNTVVPIFDPTMHKSSSYLLASMNEHKWYGLLSTFNWQLAKRVHFTGGIDGRYYRGRHYQTPYDLLGGDYMTDASDPNIKPIGLAPASHVRKIGDKTGYFNDSKVTWAGLFAQAEYKKDRLSVFVTLTGNQSSYQYINYFAKKDIYISSSKFYRQAVGYGDTLYTDGTNAGVISNPYGVPGANGIVHNPDGSITFKDNMSKQYVTLNKNYTTYDNQSKEARTNTSRAVIMYGYTTKAGANYNLTDHHNVFVNLGYMSLVPKFNNVFGNNGLEQANVKNQIIFAAELGYGIKYKKFALNLNGYYTTWQNKPLDFTPSKTDNEGNLLYYNINGINARHKGIEMDANYKILNNLRVEAFGALADWRYTSGMTTAYVYDNSNTLIQTVNFSANGVHVGNSAQDQVGASIRYEPIKNLYVKPRISYFAKNYAQFDPGNLTYTTTASGDIDPKTDYRDRESMKLPNYYFVELFAGYSYKFKYVELVFTGSIQNLLNNVYLTDASFPKGTVPLNYNDPNYATYYMSQGRRYNLSLAIKL